MTKQLEALIAKMKAAAEKATQGEWSLTYGDSSFDADDGLIMREREGYIPIARIEGAARESGYEESFQQEQQANAEFIASVQPANVLAVIAALEQSQRANAAQDDHINQQQDRIEQLEKGHQEAAKHITSWRRLAKQNIAEREKDIAELDDVRQRLANAEHQLHMAELAKYNLRASRRAQFHKRRAAEKRIANLESTLELEREKSRRVMSRNHQLEASPLAVKLPEPSAWRRDSGLFGGFVVTVSGKVAEHWQNDNQSATPMYAHADVIEAIRAAGGTVEGR